MDPPSVILVSFLFQVDFSNMPYQDNSFDKIYSIEATCHAANKIDPYKEAFRVLKPGGLYAIYEWIMTETYNPEHPHHMKIKEDIMVRGEGDKMMMMLI